MNQSYFLFLYIYQIQKYKNNIIIHNFISWNIFLYIIYIYLYLLYDHCYSIFKYSNIYQFFQFMIGFNSHYHSILSCTFIVHNFFYICSRIINNFSNILISNILISNMQMQIKLLLTSYHSHVIIITNAIINSFDNLERFNDWLIHS